MKPRINKNPQDLSISTKLRERRLELGFSQKDLAKHLDVSLQQIHKYEKNIDRISATRLYELAKLFSVSLNYFFDEREEGIQEKISC